MNFKALALIGLIAITSVGCSSERSNVKDLKVMGGEEVVARVDCDTMDFMFTDYRGYEHVPANEWLTLEEVHAGLSKEGGSVMAGLGTSMMTAMATSECKA